MTVSEPPTATPRGTRLVAVVATTGMLLVAALHAIWTVTPWPLATWDRFGRVVLGAPDGRVPPELPLYSPVVAALLTLAAYFVLARTGQLRVLGPRWVHRIGLWTVAAVFLLRATIAGFAPSALGWVETSPEYVRWDLALYSPLCLMLALSSAALARRPLP